MTTEARCRSSRNASDSSTIESGDEPRDRAGRGPGPHPSPPHSPGRRRRLFPLMPRRGDDGPHYAVSVSSPRSIPAGVAVEEVVSVDPDLVDAMATLVPQLSSSAAPLTTDDLAAIVDNPATVLYVARSAERIVGSLTLALFPLPTGIRAWIEDVVVDEAARGAGVGAALSEAAIEHARAAGARTVDLTSRPSREAANRMYQRIGFVKRETNVYRFDLGPKPPSD